MKKNILIASSIILLSSCVTKKHHNELVEQALDSQEKIEKLEKEKLELKENLQKQLTAVKEEKVELAGKYFSEKAKANFLEQEVIEKEEKNKALQAKVSKNTESNTYDLSVEIDKVSYSLGANTAKGMSDQGLKAIKFNAFAQGFNDVYSNNPVKLTPDQAQAALQGFFNKTEENKINKQEIKQTQPMNLENEIDKVSYSVAVNIAQNIKSQGLTEINQSAFAQGIKDVYESNTAKIDEAEAQQILQSFFQKQQEKQFIVAKEAGENFLEFNAKREEVTVLPSGLQYEVIKMGDGEKPTAESTVKTHYHGTLIDGDVFDSSVERGEPISFPVGGVIAGWTEALQLMPVGSKWKLYIPYNLAYGERGAGQKIGPYSALVFEVELLGIE
mgnify:CR=1 FL=1